MTLSDVEALELLKQPKYLSQKAEALKWQNRVRFHGLTVRDKNASAYWPTFKRWVESFLLVPDKRDIFDNIFPFPTPCTDVLAEVQDAYMKLFDAVNPHLIIDGAEGVESELLAYLDESGEPDFWPDEAIAALFESPEDILLIDLRPDVTGRPAPYLSRIQLESVISVEFKDDATCEYVAYITSDGGYVLADDERYRVYQMGKEDYELVDTYPHFLGRCPARKLWDERVPNHPIASASIVDEILSRLDQYAMWYVFYDMFKLYGAFPIYYGQKTVDDLEAQPRYLPTNGDGTLDAGFVEACSPYSTGGSSFIAPGEMLEIQPGGDMSVPPVGIVEPSTDSLTFQSEDIHMQRSGLIDYMVGVNGENALMNKAVNDKQVTAGFVEKQNRLLYLSRHLSAARQWGILTMGQLRHGTSGVVAVDHSFGTEFYLQTESELWKGLGDAKLAGSPRTMLYEKIRGIESFRLRTGGNPNRSEILLDLEPLLESTITELQGLIALGLVDPKDVAVKLQFTDLIRQMERKAGADITLIGSGLPYEQRIETLKQFLYVNAKYTKPEPVDPGRPGATA